MESTTQPALRRSARLAAKEQERIAKEQERIAKVQERIAKLSFVTKAVEEARIKATEDRRVALEAADSKADKKAISAAASKQILAAMQKASKEACVAWRAMNAPGVEHGSQ